MKTIEITAKNFSCAIRICRKFLSGSATAMAVECRDMITIEAHQTENGAEATFWASDGYRAVSYTVPLVKMEGVKEEDGGFVAAIRNPVFTPKDGTHVAVELGRRSKQLFATVNYLEYGISFATKQVSGIRRRLRVLKDAIEQAAKAEPKAEFQGNSRYIRSAMEAVETTNLVYGLTTAPIVHLRVNEFPNPIYAEGRGVKAIVLPTRH